MTMRVCVILFLCAFIGCGGNEPRRNGAASSASEDAAAARSTFCVYMSPAGDDDNPGTMDSPLRSLQGVHDLLATVEPQSDITVKIRSDIGPYENQTVRWEYCRRGANVFFEPYPDSVFARFTGRETDAVFFTFENASSGATNLHFRRLSIGDYARGAIWFIGDGEEAGRYNSNNSVIDCVFHDIGNQNCPEKAMCYGVVDVVNSRNNVIERCAFSNCGNANTRPSRASTEGNGSAETLAIVCIYLAHHSSGNVVRRCTFENIKGDGIRIRDESNDNEIHHNDAVKTGWNAFCSMWYRHPLCTPGGAFTECPSVGNTLHDNIARGNWECERPRIFKDLRPQSNPYGGCPDESESARIDIFDNEVEDCRHGAGAAPARSG